MTLPWHARNHQDALDGMLMLTLEERGAYNTCLDLIYSRSGPIPDDPRWLSGWMGVSLRRWTTIRAALLVKGKLFEICTNGVPSLMNQRAANEIENSAKLQRNLSESGAKGGRKSAETRRQCNENNVSDQAPLEATLPAPLKLYTYTSTEEVDSEAKASGAEPPSLNSKAWDNAVTVLVGQADMTVTSARAFFGKLLSTYGLEAGDLLGAIGEAESQCTPDPRGFLTKAAQRRSQRRRGAIPEKRVSFV